MAVRVVFFNHLLEPVVEVHPLAFLVNENKRAGTKSPSFPII